MDVKHIISNIKKYDDKSFNWIFKEIVVEDIYRLSNLTNPSVIVDVGANIGMFSILATLTFPDAKIISYEPQIEAYKILEHNVKDYPNIELHKEAFGDGSDLHFARRRGATNLGHRFLKNSKGYKVTSVDLKTIVESNDIDLSEEVYLKMDCEGGEETLETEQNLIFSTMFSHIGIEIHTCPPFNVKLGDWLVNMEHTHDVTKLTNKRTANIFSLLKRQ